MKRVRRQQARPMIVAGAGLMLWFSTSTARAQSSSLFRQEIPATQGAPLTLANTSWLYQAAETPRVIKINDIITVLVDEKSQLTSEADISRRKQAQLNAQLKDFIKLDHFNIQKAPQAQGDPAVNATLQGQFRANADLETRDSLKFRISARIVDIRPNGHLVLEAHRTIRNNDEQWDQSLTGIVRPEDLLPNNTVLSEKIAELSIHKRERGHVRDGYRRGWLYLLFDKYGLF